VTTKPVRTNFGYDRAANAEWDWIAGPLEAWTEPGTVPGLIYAHGATGTATKVLQQDQEYQLLYELARHFVVVVADLGYDTFCNDTAITRIGLARQYLQEPHVWTGKPMAKPGKVILAGGSMGAGNSLAYARANPTHVAAVAALIPFVDIQDVVTNNRLGLADDINTAYGGHYDDAVHGPTHSPVRFAASMDPDIPIHLWTASNDPATVPATATEFVALRPQTGRTNVGALGHTFNVYGAAHRSVVDFCRLHRP
jgi:hypothetical protein